MSKRNQQDKVHSTNRVGSTVSVDRETAFVPSYEDIQKKAYQIHEQKGGSDLENWLEAEQALKGDNQFK